MFVPGLAGTISRPSWYPILIISVVLTDPPTCRKTGVLRHLGHNFFRFCPFFSSPGGEIPVLNPQNGPKSLAPVNLIRFCFLVPDVFYMICRSRTSIRSSSFSFKSCHTSITDHLQILLVHSVPQETKKTRPPVSSLLSCVKRPLAALLCPFLF